MPFGSKAKAYNNSKSLAYLTAEQAIADFAVLLADLKRNLSAEGSPVVLFGGSYGGSKSYLELLITRYVVAS
jgi:lysosomal Pro-X carboxypeptidase